MQTLSEAYQNSCNIACVQQALGVGARTFYKYVGAFGLFDSTGLGAGPESRGIWWDERLFFDKKNQSQLAVATFGQTFRITPMQMITAVAATINGGYMMQPYLISQVTDSSGNIVNSTEPTMLRQVISSETSAAVRMILEDVVVSGTGTNAQVKGYRIGGKTGTSENIEQVATQDEGDKKDYIVSFVGFAPADDPQIIILLLLDTPSHGTGIYIGGGSMAAPLVGNILADVLPLSLGIMPQLTEEDLKDINVVIPRVTGRKVDEVILQLENQGFEYAIVGEGDTVRGQLPMQNAYVASGTVITLYTEEEPPRETVTVPSLTGMRYSDAERALRNRGLFIRTTGASRSNSKTVVTVQSMPYGAQVAYGSVIEVTLIDRDIIELHT
jgi:stage V sporulation protein D (sporulation-specific penicillin-binding protein)